MPEIWVFIRGLARETGHWGAFAEMFEQTFPERRVVYLDIPGAGENREMDPPVSVGGCVEIMRDQLKQNIGPNDKYVLFGVSLGAMICMDWMNRYPKEILRCTLVNPSSKKHSRFYQRLRGPAFLPMIKAMTASSTRKRELEILKLVSNRPEIYKDTVTQWAKIAKDRPMKPLAAGKQLAAAALYSAPDCFSSDLKVQVFVSLGDRMVEPQCGLDIAKSYGWSIKTHPWGGHELTLDDPSWVINALA